MAVANIRRRGPRQPMGRMAGLLAGCMVTLIGIYAGLDPFTILCRALISGLAVGLTLSTGISVIRVANIPSETKANP